MTYQEEFLFKLFNTEIWPEISNAHFVSELYNLANEVYEKHTIEGYMAALLIYHQITDEMIRTLLDSCQFYIQCRLFSVEISFKREKDKVFGFYLTELKNTMAFEGKEEFLSKCRELNSIRKDVVHKITRNESIQYVQNQMKNVKRKFEDIFKLFYEIYDWFWWWFKQFRKGGDWGEEFYKVKEKVLHLKESLEVETCPNKHTLQLELKKFEQLIHIVKRWEERDYQYK